ncbi:DNA polymerase III subunit gamma/tau [Elioraea sp.]|uniref:DNA polymerase III subunit gamma/tau n=1 Tax=Elioraea sp. TaxID=2185103 RepID=UPI003F72BB51
MSDLFGSPAEEPPPPEGPGLFGEAEPAPLPPPRQGPAPYRVLARKYRPQGFEALIGQEAMVRTLANAFATGRIAHAFMLTGVRGVGKTTTARIIARALNCTGADGTVTAPTITPCGVCDSCRAIAEDRHPDVMEIDAASNTGVQNVRDVVIEGARYAPISARHKVYIVDEVHMLSTAAFNALLKTLEEPPPHVKFVFATTEIRKVPVTVLSRCQRFDLRRIAAERLTMHFAEIAGKEGAAAEEEALRLIARAADGSVRDGLSLLDQAIALAGEGPVTAAAVRSMLGLADREQVWDLFEATMAGRFAEALSLLGNAHAAGADPAVVVQDLLGVTHAVTRAKLVPGAQDGLALAEVERVRGPALAARLSVPQLGRAWQMLLKGLAEVNEASDRLAAAEMVLIRLAHVADLPTPGELAHRLMRSEDAPAGGAAPSGGGGLRAIAGGAVRAEAAPVAAPRPASAIASLRDIVALAGAKREARLAAEIAEFMHLVRLEDGLLEVRPEPDAPRELAARVGALLSEATGRRWTVALSAEPGAATLAEQDRDDAARLRREVEAHPLVRAVLEAFPGAVIGEIRGGDAPDAAPAGSPEADVIYDDITDREDDA